MAGRNKTPLLGWHPRSVELLLWVRAESARRDVPMSRILDEALEAYRRSVEASQPPP